MDIFTTSTVVLLALCVLWRSTFGFALVVAIQMVFREVGLITLASLGSTYYSTVWIFLGSLLMFIVGYLITEMVLRNRRSISEPTLTPLNDRAVMAVVVTAGTLAMYHLVVGGIPLFSSSIETARFDFTSSGIFGIPGRMYLFGINIAWVVASANAQAHGMRWRAYYPWRWATAVLLVAAVLSGFKGELLSLAYSVVAVYVIVSKRRLTFGAAVRKYWWIGAIGIAYFAAIAALYPSYSTRGDSVVSQFYSRLTTIPAQPIQYAIEGYGSVGLGTPIFSDFTYFLQKYGGGDVTGMYTFERAVSASIIGVDPSSSAFTTPVTVSAFAELYVSFGIVLALLAMALCGSVFSFGESAPRHSTLGLIMRAVIGIMMVSWLVKGGLAYHFLNFAAVTLMLALVGVAAHFMFPAANRGRSPEFHTTEHSTTGPDPHL